MTRRKHTRILWIDDQIGGYGPFVSALEDAGFTVTAASTYDEAMNSARAAEYDVILVDIRMPSPDGIEILRQIHPIQPQAALAALSSFHYLPVYRNQLGKLDFPVDVIDKDIPNVDAPDFDARFVSPIRDLAAHGVTKTIQAQERMLQRRIDIDPFAVPLADFMAKSVLEKDRLVDLAKQRASKLLERAFAEGKCWVLLCGSSEQIRASASHPGEVLSEDEIMDFARSQNRPPFQFFAPLEVEDFWSGCDYATGLRDYPTVTLQFNSSDVSVHFDTGAPMTFFSYEELLRLDAIRPTSSFGTSSRGRQQFRAIPLNAEVILKDQSGGPRTAVHLRGQVVRDWEKAPFARFCNHQCDHLEGMPTSRGKRLCPERVALVGRNLLTENNLILVLDGIERRTRIAQPDT